jgi:hypothetical protein
MILFVVPLTFRLFTKDREEEAFEAKSKQVNTTTNADISSKSPNQEEVSEIEVSPAKMNPNSHESE